MDRPSCWWHMTNAPRDGSRILVTVRSSEQGPAEVDVAYWAKADQYGIEGMAGGRSPSGTDILVRRPRAEMPDAAA